jgi:hypothetical protein
MSSIKYIKRSRNMEHSPAKTSKYLLNENPRVGGNGKTKRER